MEAINQGGSSEVSKDKNGAVRSKRTLIDKNSVSYEIFAFLFGNISSKEEKDALFDLHDFIESKKPSLQTLLRELMYILKQKSKKILKDKLNPLNELLPKILKSYRESKREFLHPLIPTVFMKSLSKLKLRYPDHFDKGVTDIGLEYWTKIDNPHLKEYLRIFEIRGLINVQDLFPLIEKLMSTQKLERAVDYIGILNIYDKFDIKDIINKLVKYKGSSSIIKIAKSKPDYAEYIIQELLKNKNAKDAGAIVKDLNLNSNDFPPLLETLKRSSLRFHMTESDWMSIEEKFCDSKQILGFYVDELVRQKKLDIAFSVAQRYQILNEEFLTKDSCNLLKNASEENSSTKEFRYIENELFTKDAYVPSEELLGTAKSHQYIHINDFGLEVDRDLILVDDCESALFIEAINRILEAKFVGIDSEFKFVMTRFDESTTDLLQLATSEKIYLFDALKLSKSEEYNNFIYRFLSDANIIKIGHTLSADLHKLRESREGDQELIITNQIDVAKVYRKVHPAKKYGLAAISEDLFGKPMSKYDQMSNWRNRPLRKSQMHYAGLDAYIVLKVFDKLRELSNLSIEEFVEKNVETAQTKKNEKSTKKSGKNGKDSNDNKDDDSLDEDSDLEEDEDNDDKEEEKPLENKIKSKDNNKPNKVQNPDVYVKKENNNNTKKDNNTNGKSEVSIKDHYTKQYVPKKN